MLLLDLHMPGTDGFQVLGYLQEHRSALPMIPISFARGGAVLNYFSLITTVGTPQTIAAQELRIECMYPADDETETLHVKLLAH